MISMLDETRQVQLTNPEMKCRSYTQSNQFPINQAQQIYGINLELIEYKGKQ